MLIYRILKVSLMLDNQTTVFRYDTLQRYVPRLRQRITNDLCLVGESDPNCLWASGKKSVVKTATISKAVTLAIKSDTGDDD